MNNFDVAFEFIMDHEDRHRTGKVTVDAGGVTRWGIAQKFNPDVDVANLTLDGAKEIYRTKYFLAHHLDQIFSAPVAAKLADMMVNPGPIAAKLVQAIVGTPADGIIGAFTLARINHSLPNGILQALCSVQADYYRTHDGDKPYLAGLLARAADKPCAPVDVNTEAV
jgi:lysozyme family protein